jgi:thiamine biosynthesis lipoprotein
VAVESRLLALLQETLDYATEFDGAYDPTAGPLVALWRLCRRERRIPTPQELEAARSRLGFREILIDSQRGTIHLLREGIELNLNAIGKGYALDRAAEVLLASRSEADHEEGEGWDGQDERRSSALENVPPDETVVENELSSSGGHTDCPAFLIHGGHSSILARGSLTGLPGWPIALRHPLIPNRTLATLILRDRAMSTSGSAVQFFRVGEKRYGHILDPRSGWPAEGILSVTVIAPTAARAEALSTAFFVAGVEKAREYCHNHLDVAALIVPAPATGQRLEPVNCGIAETDLFWETDG